MTPSTATRRTRRTPRAFTLVELLVVIGIIALLIGILLPTLSQARQAAASVKCLSNLRSIGQAMQGYANDYNQVMVPGEISIEFRRQTYASLLVAGGYVPGLVDGQGANNTELGTETVFNCPDGLLEGKSGTTTDLGNPENMKDGRGAQFVRGNMSLEDSNGFVDTWYGWNAFGGVGNLDRIRKGGPLRPMNRLVLEPGGTSDVAGVGVNKISSFRNSANLALIFDGYDRLGATVANINLRHKDDSASNFLYADGHAASVDDGVLLALEEAAIAEKGDAVRNFSPLLENKEPSELTLVIREPFFRTDQN